MGLLCEKSTRPKFQGEAVVKASGLLLVSELERLIMHSGGSALLREF